MARRAPDTKDQLAKFSLRLPLIYREYFDGIDRGSQSVAVRKLLAFAVANGGLVACGYKPTQFSAAYAPVAPAADIDVDDLPDSALTPDQLAERYAE